ncbi:MAG: hypothetical protein Q8N67_04545 [Candidatus Omnitrophota bacterium]|nr:hypothetical protein [Candidatus Omnitrophota bacterium]
MKLALIIFLTGLVIFLGLSVFGLRKEFLNAREHTISLEERNDLLQKELMRLNRVCSEKERFLNEIKQGITELESKVPLETLERYTPKKTWDEIKPIVDRLRFLQETRENRTSSGEEGDYKQ